MMHIVTLLLKNALDIPDIPSISTNLENTTERNPAVTHDSLIEFEHNHMLW